jgi:hypothetical protein
MILPCSTEPKSGAWTAQAPHRQVDVRLPSMLRTAPSHSHSHSQPKISLRTLPKLWHAQEATGQRHVDLHPGGHRRITLHNTMFRHPTLCFTPPRH